MTTPVAEAGPYSRFYWRFRDEFPDIYADKETFGWWMSLLANAEGSYPTAPEMPRKIKARSVQVLIDAELLTLLPNDRYRIRGVDAEMKRRSEKGKAGAAARWGKQSEGNASGNATGNANAMPRRDETSKDEHRQDETRTDTGAPATFVIPVKGMDGSSVEVTIGDPDAPPSDVLRLQKLAETLTSTPYAMQAVHSGLGLKAVNEQLTPHGYDRVARVWAQIAKQVNAAGGPGSRPTLRQLVLGADDILNPVPRRDVKEAKAEDEKAAYDRRVERTRREIDSLRTN